MFCNSESLRSPHLGGVPGGAEASAGVARAGHRAAGLVKGTTRTGLQAGTQCACIDRRADFCAAAGMCALRGGGSRFAVLPLARIPTSAFRVHYGSRSCEGGGFIPRVLSRRASALRLLFLLILVLVVLLVILVVLLVVVLVVVGLRVVDEGARRAAEDGSAERERALALKIGLGEPTK